MPRLPFTLASFKFHGTDLDLSISAINKFGIQLIDSCPSGFEFESNSWQNLSFTECLSECDPVLTLKLQIKLLFYLKCLLPSLKQGFFFDK